MNNIRETLFHILEEDVSIREKLEPEQKNFLVDRVEEELLKNQVPEDIRLKMIEELHPLLANHYVSCDENGSAAISYTDAIQIAATVVDNLPLHWKVGFQQVAVVPQGNASMLVYKNANAVHTVRVNASHKDTVSFCRAVGLQILDA